MKPHQAKSTALIAGVVMAISIPLTSAAQASTSPATASGAAQRVHRSPTRASSTSPLNACVLPEKSQCMNDWLGNLTQFAQAVRFYHYGNSGGNNRIYATNIGTIHGCGTSGGFQPFADGSGLNCRYNGQPVYQFQWGKNGPSGVCIAGDNNMQYAFNEGCNEGPATWFVISSENFLVGVGASNVLYDEEDEADVPVWLGENSGDGNGAHVYLTAAQALSLEWGFLVDGG